MNYIKNLANFIKGQFRVSRLKEDRAKINAIVKKNFKTFFLILSLCGLIYQVQVIYDKYISGKTSISLQISKLSEKSIPGITICFKKIFSMERAGTFHHGFKNISKNYLELLKNKHLIEAFQLYENSFVNYTDENLKNNGMNCSTK